ncbi:RsmD family RNA methyltransferase [uncultured Campylobacter sp.]|uniref:RsmD family RNA methyltransferase n=1 Tax=uncultured Campylobacter sp. TaxID=218934 RepID=UPI002629DF51|nr:RsmD family RNA methyltransferase [uncultured Campylobacter sp.]
MDNYFNYITSGFLKGKKLQIPPLLTTRSTKNRVKESFFDSLRDELRNRVFIEGFGGSGIMAASALSNGAMRAYAIEKDEKAFKILQKNFRNLDSRLIAINGDFFQKIASILEEDEEFIIYIDPPFDLRSGFCDIYERVNKFIASLKDKRAVFIVIEHSSKVEFSETIGEFRLKKSKRFGRTTLSYYE